MLAAALTSVTLRRKAMPMLRVSLDMEGLVAPTTEPEEKRYD